MASKHTSNKPVGVIGAGRFGTVVAQLIAQHTDVLVYVRSNPKARQLPPNSRVTTQIKEIAEQCDVIFPIIPSGECKTMIQEIAPWLKPHHVLIHGIKGLDVTWPDTVSSKGLVPLTRGAIKTMSETILAETCVTKVGCLSGPNLAKELSQGHPAATVIAGTGDTVIEKGNQLLRNKSFQVYRSNDLLGVELCGVLKNIMAIAAGIIAGLGYGENTKALLISRGMVEMIHIGQVMGATVQPFLGLAGIGDLMATCSSSLSRNHTLGYQLGQGKTLQKILQTPHETTEGIKTVKIIHGLMTHYQARAPITKIIYEVLFEDLPAQEAVQYLMKYPLNDDVDFL